MSDDGFCPTLRPTRAAFERPFCDYVHDVFAKHPGLACFKVVPPKGWRPRKAAVNLDQLRINTPIKQHVFGRSGAYVCILEEHRGMSAADFKRLAARPEHQPPAKGHRDDHLRERAFWSGVTNSPPLYGADTPLSLFDTRLAWGWNLRRLGCMLQDKRYDVPNIPGVTSPMTYFGMWRSFFGWHKEDIDLYSTNFLHFGAPKVWYCVAPRHMDRFEAMARALYPDLYRSCHGFMRHKDILVSPNLLRAYNVPFLRAKQEAGEFMVLNAAAYHAGFNLGFNCAEAVNFAMEGWLEAGKAAVPCTCSALPQGVQLDMGIFCPELRQEGSSEEEDSGNDDDDEGSGEEEEEAEGGSGSEEEAESLEEEEEEEEEPQTGGRGKRQRGGRHAAPGGSDTEGGSEGGDETPAAKRRRGAAGTPKPVRTPKLPAVLKAARGGEAPRDAAPTQWGGVAEAAPLAVVARDEHTRQLSFRLVHRLAKPSSKAGAMWVGLLREDADGLFRPQPGAKQLLSLGLHYPRVVRVRAEWLQREGRRRGGWALKTKRERILM